MRNIIVALCLAVLPVGAVFAQGVPKPPESKAEPEPAPGEVLMLEEIRIEVAPEEPTVVVMIPRQKPHIDPVTLQIPVERLVFGGIKHRKPKLAQMKISKIENAEKMLAKQRGD